ncbi:DUF6354 family protein [Streptomyces sp. NRRL F-2580]|uniref:DUF6354 family protein n=1 Tax=Streptomyces sp. NRRL F-2580 TaxID=1463841 RepID=UPI0004C5D687|nr:DUF6354 family protein [Streptomyces sp. NRRL F-2580]
MAAAAVTEGQLYRDLAPDMKARDRRLRVTKVGETRAELVVEHDLAGLTGKATHASLVRLRSSSFELIEDATDDDPQYPALLAAISEVHRRDATPADYARAALHVVREISQ